MNSIENYRNVINEYFDKGDQMNAMQMMQNLLILYQTKYEINPEILENSFETEFRNDTKLVFETIHKRFVNDECMKYIETEFDDNDETDQTDKQEFMNFIDNIVFVLQKVDTVDLVNPNEDFHTNCTNAMLYLNRKNKDMIELTNKMKILSKRVELISEAFTPINQIKLKMD